MTGLSSLETIRTTHGAIALAHLEAQIEPTRILLKRDAIISTMLRQLGATVREVKEKFQPEHGAYHGHAH